VRNLLKKRDNKTIRFHGLEGTFSCKQKEREMAEKKTQNNSQKKSQTKKTSEKIENKAKSGRSDTRVPIQLLVDYSCNGHYLFDFCKNLGTGGVFIQTEAPLPQGSTVDLTFTIPDSKETLKTAGKVIWVQEDIPGRKDLAPGMGVQFERFNEEQRKLLEDFVSRYHGAKYSMDDKDKKSA
jgi:uncharacterized protein (TIGR02266 family)